MKTFYYLIFTFFCIIFPILADPIFSNSQIVDRIQNSLSKTIIEMQNPDTVIIIPVNKNWIEISIIPGWDPNNKKFLNKLITPKYAENPDIYKLKDLTSNKNLKIIKSGLKRRVLFAPLPNRRNDLRIAEKIFINTEESLVPERKYKLIVDSNLIGCSIDKTFTFSPEHSISQIIHIDPYGFRCNDNKNVYLGLNMGSAGEINPDPAFEVINLNTGKVVHKGYAEQQIYNGWPEHFVNKPYSRVYCGDFSDITEPGNYIVKHSAGYGFPFTVSDDIYRITMNTLALGMYHQRRGENILSKYTRFSRKSTIEDQTFVYDSKKLDPFVKNLLKQKSPDKQKIIYPTNMEGKKVSFDTAGHMDAGDYSPYTYNSCEFVFIMTTTLDFFKEKVFHDNLGIPESGDGIPDLLQEMMIELNWLKCMQDPEDGGVFTMSKPLGRSYQNTMPGEDKTLKRYLAPKDTNVTASYTAALARAARSPIVKKYYPELVTELKERAIKSWKWLEKNDGFHGYHHYGAINEDTDDRAWAAIELYALTGDTKYHEVFKKLHKPLEKNNGVGWMNGGFGNVNRELALWDYYKIPYTIDSNLKKISERRYLEYLVKCVQDSENMPYNLVFDNAFKRHYRLGWFFPVSNYSWDLLIGYKLHGYLSFKETALNQIHYTLGANPLNKTFITGLGYNRLHEIVDQKSFYDGIEQPVTGIPVSPVTTARTIHHKYGKYIDTTTYPGLRNTSTPDWRKIQWTVYGILELPYDGWNISSEMTIEKLAAMLCTAAIVTPVTEIQYKRPIFKLKIKKIDDNKYKPVIEFKNKPKTDYYLMWYINGMPVSADSDFIFEFKDNKYTSVVGLEVLTVTGKRFYDEIKVTRPMSLYQLYIEHHKNKINVHKKTNAFIIQFLKKIKSKHNQWLCKLVE